MRVIGTDENGDEIAEVSAIELDTMFKEIRAKAIDEFAEALKEKYGCLGYIDEITFKEVDEIADKLRG
ncbi:MAG: hypothetical protein IJA10_11560 [Lachnospiraceae bacterium]|nr:hypothetical protein [Lachnospiraceae bacterium]